MIILGLGARQIVDWSRLPWNRWGTPGLRTIDDLQGLLETAVIETMALENSISRNRAIAGMVATGAKLIETGELEERIAALELATGPGTAAADEPSDGSLLGSSDP